MRNLFPFVVLLATHQIYGQPDAVATQTRQLERAISQYEVDYRNLATQRGFKYNQRNFRVSDLKEHIASYASDAVDEEIAEFKFLFYHFYSDSLRAWLFNSSGDVDAFHVQRMTADSLLTLERTLKFQIRIQNLLATRESKRAEQDAKKYRLTRDQAVDKLSRILFPESISGKLIGVRYLAVLPCLNISSIPYGMLTPWNNGSVVHDSLAYAFVHNVADFFETTQRLKGERYNLTDPLVVGNPSFTNPCSKDLPDLPGAQDEALQIGRLLQSSPLVGKEATRTTVVRRMARSSFIYLATHGYTSHENPMDESFIALYEPDACGLLTPREIQELRLNETAIVILSACETGNGKTIEAGVIGLARGFLKGGAKSVTMSLWAVDDHQTKEFMLIFLEELQRQQFFFPAENFRQAVLRYRKERNNDPIHWASFQNFGTPFPLMMRYSLSGSSAR